MSIVTNADGLTIKFGTSEADVGRAGEYETSGGVRVLEFALDLVDVTSATAGATVIDYNATLPKGARIEQVQVITTTAVTGTNAALNLGLVRSDMTTELDYDGLGKAAVLTQTAMADVGNTLTYVDGTTNAGALVGTVLAYNGTLVADYDTAAFEAGRISVRINYSFPL
jgi:hypothetical protein